ncbi:tyrosine-protein kinase domain-containing protein [Candidatus Cyanaurora vandensis]|uniref:GumC family protein n=1 Tax=Candidatus Cyanaurora vandensis TaxID=2714958 RepID=UPI00257C7558|nr:tyrosine-protein kinase domain-containing protein [Candidatus Cyanaurora vandensis]
MHPVFGILTRHRLPALTAFTVVLGSCLLTGALTPAQYESQTKLLFQEVGPTLTEGLPGLVDTGATFTRTSNPIENQVTILTTDPILASAIQSADLRHPETKKLLLPSQLRKDLEIRPILGTDIVTLSHKGTDPAFSQRAVTAVTEALVKDVVTNNRARATQVRTFLQEKLPQVERDLRKAEQRLQNFQSRSGSVAMGAEAESAVSNLATLEAQERTLRGNLTAQDSQIRDLTRKLGGQTVAQAVTAVAVSEDPDVQALRAKQAELDAEVTRQRTRLGDQHPQLQALLRQQTALKTTLDQRIQAMGGKAGSVSVKVNPVSQGLTRQLAELQVTRSGTQEELSNVQRALAQYRGRVAALPQRQVQYAQLVRTVDLNSTTVTLLSRKLEEAKLAEAQGFSSVRVVEPASEPRNPVWPNFLILAVAGSVVGAVVAGGVVLIRELLNRKVMTEADAQYLLQMPVLGSLPLLTGQTTPLIKTWSREAYRMLCTNLRFLTRDTHGKAAVVVVSSAVPNEGKSTVASQMAIAMAKSGQRTLLIDGDLVRPSLARAFQVQEEPGFGEWLQQARRKGPAHLATYIQPTTQSRLSLLTAGHALPEDSASLLESSAVELLVRQLEDQYDQIIIDTPPLGAFAHGYLLGAKARGILLVVRPEVTDQQALLRVKQRLENNGIPLLGLVCNGVDNREQLSYGYGDSYERGPKAALTLELPASRD